MNQAINSFWTILCFIPVIMVWVSEYSVLWLCVFLVVSVLSQLIPAGLLQLSLNPQFYERLGVKFIRKFVQHGQYVNQYFRRNDHGHKTVKNKAMAFQYQNTILMYQRFHLICFLFFILTAVYAFALHIYMACVLTFLSNIIYNICPILLQQYNRARLQKLANK
jgi:hypothetical protein